MINSDNYTLYIHVYYCIFSQGVCYKRYIVVHQTCTLVKLMVKLDPERPTILCMMQSQEWCVGVNEMQIQTWEHLAII